MTVHEAIQRHIRDCGQCQDALRDPPNTIATIKGGRKPGYCGEYFEIFQEFADFEREANKGILISREQFIDEMRDQ